MIGANEQVLLLPKAKRLAYGLLVSMFVALILPLAAHAEDPQNLEGPAENAGQVESPGAPSGTSQADSFDIVWTWSAPAGGLTPDAVPSENPDEAPAEQPSDIIQYGYEFFNQNGVIASGVVGTDVLSKTVTVNVDGDYTFKVWSITRAGATSAQVSGTISFVAPILPDLPPLEVPDPIDITPVTNNSVATNGNTIGGSTPIINKDTMGYLTGDTNANILSSDKPDRAVAGADTAAVVKASKQGWMILGLAWYVWLIILVVGFFIGRRVLIVARNNSK